MAKKTAKAPTAKKPATKKSPAKTAPKAATAKPTLTDHAIGEAAGEVWLQLTKTDSLTLAALKKGCSGGDELAVMAIGWLAREGKLAFETKGRSVKVSLAG